MTKVVFSYIRDGMQMPFLTSYMPYMRHKQKERVWSESFPEYIEAIILLCMYNAKGKHVPCPSVDMNRNLHNLFLKRSGEYCQVVTLVSICFFSWQTHQ